MRLNYLCACALLWLAAACESESVHRVGESCLVNSDCTASLVCIFQTCHIQCRRDVDCREAIDEESLCQRGAQPTNVCQNKDERTCLTEASCAPTQVCSVDRRCRDQCRADRDCTTGQVCVQGACANRDELVSGRLPAADGGLQAGTPCSYNSECPVRLVCAGGVCRQECRSSQDCDIDSCCTEGGRCALRAFRDRQCQSLVVDAGSGAIDAAGGSVGVGAVDAASGSVGAGGGAPNCSAEADSVCDARCVDVASDPSHCGDCDTVCGLGESCIGGACTPACAADTALCNGTCSDLHTDPANCGACGVVCRETERCEALRCHAVSLDIVSGASHVCSQLDSGEIACWGYNTNQQLGDPSLAYYDPVRSPGFSWWDVWRTRVQGLPPDIVQMNAGGSEDTCVVTASGSVHCWGANDQDQLGLDSVNLATSAAPLEIEGFPEPVKHVELALGYGCAITTSGALYCWGANGNGQLGQDPVLLPRSAVPLLLGDFTNATVAVAPSALQICARRVGERAGVYCWGSDLNGVVTASSLPASVTYFSPQPIALPEPDEQVDLAQSLMTGPASHACAIAGAGQVFCWGDNSSRQLGSALPNGPVVEVQLPQRALALFASGGGTCALLVDRSLECWGYYFTATDRAPAVLLPSSARKVAFASSFAVALLEDGSLLSWGQGAGVAALGRLPTALGIPSACCVEQ